MKREMKNKNIGPVKKRIRNMVLESILILTIVAFLIPSTDADQLSTPCGIFNVSNGFSKFLYGDTYTNTLNVVATDLCASYVNANGVPPNTNPNLANLVITQTPCPLIVPVKAAGDGITWINWFSPCVANGQSVKVTFRSNWAWGLTRTTLIWTLNGSAIPNQTQGNITIPPIKPPPVNQVMGMIDTTIDSLQTTATDQSVCRSCHQTTGTNISGGYNNTIGGVPTRHHSLLPEGMINPFTNAPFGCQDCHPSTPGIGNGILLDRSCLDCHNGTNFWADSSLGAHVGNITRPHHFNTSYDDANIGTPALNRTCNFCHGSFVDNYNDGHYKPAYNTDFMITPFATFKVTNFSQHNPVPVFDSYGNQVLNKTWGGCESCHLADSNVLPYTIANNGITHHNEILGTSNVSVIVDVPYKCFMCHVITRVVINTTYVLCNMSGGSWLDGPLNECVYVGSGQSNVGEILPNAIEVRNSTIEQADAAIGAFEPGTTNITINGTGCEKCHSVKSIHNIQFNYSQNGPDGFGHINNNTDCYGCHNSWLPADTWTPGALIPTVDDISPSVITVGTATTLSITGSNFVNPDGNYTSVVTVDGVSYTPISETATQISVNIPGLSAGVHQLQLVKGGDTLSKLAILTVVNNPTITSATLSPGKNGQPATITIIGKGFGTKPTNATMYISVNHAGNQITSSSVSKWSDTQITARNAGAASGDVLTVLTANAGEATQIIQ